MRRVLHRWLPLAAACTLWLFAGVGAAQSTRRVNVRVVETAANGAYLSPGESKGVRTGTRVLFGRREFRVMASTARYAVILTDRPGELKTGARGRALVTPKAKVTAERREKPRQASLPQLRERWPAVVLPASQQRPKRVYLGAMGRERRTVRWLTTVQGGALVPMGDEGTTLARAQLRTQLHYQPWRATHAFLDASVQRWFARGLANRSGDSSRPLVRVRRLELAYGDAVSPYVALGRLVSPLAALGQLDGARVRTPSYAGVSLGAFGGVVPDPFSGQPRADVSRFGAEAVYAGDMDARPTVRVAVHGSHFEGELDERRLHGHVSVSPGPLRLQGTVELQLFDDVNPWGAPKMDLTSASLDARLRLGRVTAHVRGNLRKPERSRFLAALLPADWLCVTQSLDETDPQADQFCRQAYDARLGAMADVQVTLDSVAIAAGANVAHRPSSDESIENLGGILQVRTLSWGPLTGSSVALEAQHSWIVREFAARLELATTFADRRFQMDLRYRPAHVTLRWDRVARLEHAAGIGFSVAPNPRFSWRTDAQVVMGGPTEVVVLQSGVAWLVDQ